LIHASRVKALVRSRLAESAAETYALLPLNERARPKRPCGAHVAPDSVPRLLLPETSAVLLPVFSSNAKAATRPPPGASVVDVVDGVARLLLVVVLGGPAMVVLVVVVLDDDVVEGMGGMLVVVVEGTGGRLLVVVVGLVPVSTRMKRPIDGTPFVFTRKSM
jgi:hypothetical protein